MARLTAFIVLIIPGIAAALGIKLMRDALFGVLFSPFPYIWLQFAAGFLLLAAGIGFFAGFLFRRDQRKGRIPKKKP
ncbi:hypothetical protein NCCP2716_06280 [Sporosarcina sp. NCCP-2716]|uniref:DUF2627 domain-containing protein n=1 Tax=Sporosarcina sp. NCCP-2716 TaxID=2943679 RepID=UPI0020401A2D|nr:DUF2627 domain-containing protein [Sporosarcina sp. NCCP-2716]GKV68130.1 hypothetical protein NCCP2716_06280 [Sporosarcina sp. NCCP-2716]